MTCQLSIVVAWIAKTVNAANEANDQALALSSISMSVMLRVLRRVSQNTPNSASSTLLFHYKFLIGKLNVATKFNYARVLGLVVIL